MKKFLLFSSVLFALFFFTAFEVRAEVPDYSSVSNSDNPKPGSDNSRRAYLSWGVQSPANFNGGNRSYSSSFGISIALMLHDRPLDYKGTPNPNEPSIGDIGLEWSNFNSAGQGRSFELNNLHLQVVLPLRSPIYFKSGYGFSNLKDRAAREELTGGCWKWGFGAKLHLVNGLYANIETNRWDGPGPVGFRSQSIGMEYHF